MNGVINVDMTISEAPRKNGPFKHKHIITQKHAEHKDATDIQN